MDELVAVQDCLAAIKDWMTNNFLHLNSNKTEVLIVGPDGVAPKVQQYISLWSSNIKTNAKKPGWFLTNTYIFNRMLTRSCLFQLRNNAKFRSVVSISQLETIMHSFISAHLDYCNAFFLPASACQYWINSNWSRMPLLGCWLDPAEGLILPHIGHASLAPN